MDKRELRQIKYLRRDIEKAERQLSRKGLSPEARQDLERKLKDLNQRLEKVEDMFFDIVFNREAARERFIMMMVFDDGMSMAAAGSEIGITGAQVGRIIKRILADY